MKPSCDEWGLPTYEILKGLTLSANLNQVQVGRRRPPLHLVLGLIRYGRHRPGREPIQPLTPVELEIRQATCVDTAMLRKKNLVSRIKLCSVKSVNVMAGSEQCG